MKCLPFRRGSWGVAVVGLAGLLATLLAGCGADAYRPYKNGVGYSDVQLAPDVYQVYYEAPASMSYGTAQRLALVRAAQLAQANGKPYFVVLNSRSGQRVETDVSPGLRPGRYGELAYDDPLFYGGTYYGGYARTYERPLIRMSVKLLDESGERGLEAAKVIAQAQRDELLKPKLDTD